MLGRVIEMKFIADDDFIAFTNSIDSYSKLHPEYYFDVKYQVDDGTHYAIIIYREKE